MWVCQGCRCLKALAEMVIIDEMPFRSVEGEGFKRYSKVLQPRFEVLQESQWQEIACSDMLKKNPC